MQTLILILHVVLCIFLIIVVLLQPGKGGDAGIAFGGGGGSQSVFGARGATTFLQKLTTYAAVLFMVTTITLAWYSSASLSRKSVITEDAIKEVQTEATPADKVPAPQGGETTGAAEQPAAQPEQKSSGGGASTLGASSSEQSETAPLSGAPASE